ncbi:MAG: lipopolysaccharide biosynthesis protein [Planctomycetes bacterium]|nr:lipopolysaccharide biosynthesis protein [Planctomycetota bacterium]
MNRLSMWLTVLSHFMGHSNNLIREGVLAGKPDFSRYVRLSKEAFWIGVGQVLMVAGGMATVRVLTGYLTPGQYGELALAMTLASLMQQSAFAGPGGAAMRFLMPAIEVGEGKAYFRGLVRIIFQRLGVTVVLGVIVFLTLGVWGELEWIPLALGAFGFAMVSFGPAIFNSFQSAARHRAVVACHNGVSQWLRLGFAVLIISCFGATSGHAIWGYFFGVSVVLVSQYLFYRKKIYPLIASQPKAEVEQVKKWLGQIGSYSLPFAIWGFPCWLQMATERWALEGWASRSEVGFYSVLYQLGFYPVLMLTGLVSQLVTPIVFNRTGSGANQARVQDARRLNFSLIKLSLVLAVIAVILSYLFHRQIFALLADPKFSEVSFLLPFMVLSGGLFAIGQMGALLLLSGNSTKALLAPKIVAAVIGVFFNITGAYFWGLKGVVGASIAASIIYVCLVLYRGVWGKKLEVKLPGISF